MNEQEPPTLAAIVDAASAYLDFFLDVAVIGVRNSSKDFDLAASFDSAQVRRCTYSATCENGCHKNEKGRCVVDSVSRWYVDGESFLNDPDGEVIRLVKHWDIKFLSSHTRVASLLQVRDLKILVFPIGAPTLMTLWLKLQIAEFINDGDHLLICGHSMGAGFAAQFAAFLCEEEWDVSRVFLVVTGGYPCLQSQEVEQLLQCMKGRILSLTLMDSRDNTIDPKIGTLCTKLDQKSCEVGMQFLPTVVADIANPKGVPLIMLPDTRNQYWKFAGENKFRLWSKTRRFVLHGTELQPDANLHKFSMYRELLHLVRENIV
jgi:hypothetical protein